MFKKLIFSFLLIASSGAANAALITQSDSVTRQDTDISTSLVFDMFNLGTGFELTKVTFSIDGDVFGRARVESEDAAPSVIDIELKVTLTLFDPSNNDLVISIPLFTQSFNATAFDGSTDFGGTSGISFNDLNVSKFESESYTDAATLNAFTGPGTISLDFTGIAETSASGAGNITASFSTQASGDVEVIYEYRAVEVSEPSMVALFGLGLIALGCSRRIKK
ncbi:PEP-CTERM sorting domain-containing protein [Alteromonas gracilis]|uniref:PEP-CTERM sorting domain-containing protein n=1 Tax=Alteromonas gracilis TaxID=1479524 RepID=UPI002FE2C18A